MIMMRSIGWRFLIRKWYIKFICFNQITTYNFSELEGAYDLSEKEVGVSVSEGIPKEILPAVGSITRVESMYRHPHQCFTHHSDKSLSSENHSTDKLSASKFTLNQHLKNESFHP